MLIYALLVIATLAVSTAIVVALIITCAAGGRRRGWCGLGRLDASEPSEEESDERPVVSNHGEGGGHLDFEQENISDVLACVIVRIAPNRNPADADRWGTPMSEIGVASGGPWQGSLVLGSAPQPRHGKSLMTRSQPRAHPDGGPTEEAAPVSTCDRRPRVSLALGGGGGRGITHLGVLQAFSECNVPVERISGISIGAIAGALYATGQGIGEIHQQVLAFIESPEFRRRQGQMFGATPARGHGAGASSWLSRFKRIFWRIKP